MATATGCCPVHAAAAAVAAAAGPLVITDHAGLGLSVSVMSALSVVVRRCTGISLA